MVLPRGGATTVVGGSSSSGSGKSNGKHKDVAAYYSLSSSRGHFERECGSNKPQWSPSIAMFFPSEEISSEESCKVVSSEGEGRKQRGLLQVGKSSDDDDDQEEMMSRPAKQKLVEQILSNADHLPPSGGEETEKTLSSARGSASPKPKMAARFATPPEDYSSCSKVGCQDHFQEDGHLVKESPNYEDQKDARGVVTATSVDLVLDWHGGVQQSQIAQRDNKFGNQDMPTAKPWTMTSTAVDGNNVITIDSDDEEEDEEGGEVLAVTPAARSKGDETQAQQAGSFLLEFLRQQASCLKCQPAQFYTFLCKEDVYNLQELHKAVQDDNFVWEMQQNGLLGHKITSFQTAVGAAVGRVGASFTGLGHDQKQQYEHPGQRYAAEGWTITETDACEFSDHEEVGNELRPVSPQCVPPVMKPTLWQAPHHQPSRHSATNNMQAPWQAQSLDERGSWPQPQLRCPAWTQRPSTHPPANPMQPPSQAQPQHQGQMNRNFDQRQKISPQNHRFHQPQKVPQVAQHYPPQGPQGRGQINYNLLLQQSYNDQMPQQELHPNQRDHNKEVTMIIQPRRQQAHGTSQRKMAPTSNRGSYKRLEQRVPIQRVKLPLTDIAKPFDTDVVCGRGGAANYHPGNVIYRELINGNKGHYINCMKKVEKTEISRSIVAAMREQNRRFLDKDTSNGYWFDIGDKEAIRKTSQALREGQPKLRRTILEMEVGALW